MLGARGLIVAFVLAALLVSPTAAHAYVGPGAGIGLIGAAIGLILGVVTAIGVVITWPLRNLRKRAKEGSTPQGTQVDSRVPEAESR